MLPDFGIRANLTPDSRLLLPLSPAFRLPTPWERFRLRRERTTISAMLPADCQLAPMCVDDYDEVLALWNACEGVRANETSEELARILVRNPGLSSVIRRGKELAAAVLCCHDGRRGYLYHLGVAAAFRKLGLG